MEIFEKIFTYSKFYKYSILTNNNEVLMSSYKFIDSTKMEQFTFSEWIWTKYLTICFLLQRTPNRSKGDREIEGERKRKSWKRKTRENGERTWRKRETGTSSAQPLRKITKAGGTTKSELFMNFFFINLFIHLQTETSTETQTEFHYNYENQLQSYHP